MPGLHGPVAVVAGGCRLPGSPDLEAFWALLRDGGQATGPMPAWRWIDAPARIAGVIDAPDQFDAGFFGIAPREADQMDPQQRLLLEVAWEALEAAGQTRASLAGSRTGVYVGLSSVDYARIRPDDPALLDAYAATGNAPSVAANRLSYILDLRGPSMAVDTACSSSLVAVHLACRALAAGEIDLALAGGVNLLLAPDLMTVFTAARMLAPDGRCKTFDAAADGYVRGEGCGVVVLKGLADAQAAGDPVLAVIRGTATNQDGRSNGLTAPNGQAQRAVIQAALADAGLAGEAIDAVELHGTGTPLGDPIEAQALAAALDSARRPAPCPVGSVKTNIGHLEAAAGIAGLLKAVLAARHRTLPASLNFTAANPVIGLDALGLAVAAAPAALPADRPVRLGVSSFGFGGSNAHVIVESPPTPAGAPEGTFAGPWLLPVSAHTPEALRQRAAAFVTRLRGCGPAALADLVFTAAVRRTHLDHRLAVIGADAEDLAARLSRHLDGAADTGVASGRRPPGGARTRPMESPTLPGLAALYAAGHDPDWRRIAPQGRVVDLPALPWQRRRHWYPAPAMPGPEPSAQIAHRLDWRRVPGSVSDTIAARLDDICAAYVRAALRAEPEVAPGRRAVFARLRERLARHAPGHEGPDAAAAALQALIAAEPDLAPELSLLARTGGALAAVLDGTVDPLSLLFPSGDMAALRLPYADAPAARRANRMIAAAAAREAARRGGAPRVLEIGGGTGATTDAVLAALGTARNYVFTDISPHFCAAARAAYGEQGVTCRTLDIERPPATQGFAPAAFDLVIAANVLHATRSIAEALAHIRALLAPGGALLLLETVRASWPLELTFGLTDGWWRFADRDLRPEQPLLDVPSWRAALGRAGFATSYALPCDSQGRQAVLVADGHAPRWHVCGGGEADRAALGAAMRTHGIVASADTAACDAIVDLGAPAGSAAERCAWSLDVFRAASGGSAPVWMVTQRAQPAGDTVPLADAASLWGLGRTAAIERPGIWAGLIDLDGPLDGTTATSLLAALGGGGGGHGHAAEEIALRDGAWLAPVLVAAERSGAALRLDPARRYLVTGGLGALGLEMAGWLIGCGARDVVLAGRTPPDAARRDRIAALRALGASVSSVVLDMTRPADVTDCVRTLGINGVVHAAGVHEDALLTDLDAARLDHVFGAKLRGALALDGAMQGADIDLFLLVSSAAALTGLPGAGSYTAANAALDALAASRRRRGLPGLSVGFAPLGGLGMATQVSERQRQRWAALGVRPLAAEAALARLATAMPGGPAHLLLLHLDPAAAGPLARRLRATAEAAPTPRIAMAEEPRLARLVAASFPAERPAVLAAEVAALAAAILKLPDGVSPDPERGLQDQGLDSLMALELHGRLQSLTGLRLPTTLALERPTVQALAAHLLAALDANVPAPAIVAAPRAAVAAPASGGLAAIVARIAALTDAASLAALAEPPA